MTEKSIFDILSTWELMVKFVDQHHITEYKVDPNVTLFKIDGSLLIIPPEYETVVSELLKENQDV